MTIFVVRHAEADGSAAGIIHVPGAALTPVGRRQAERLAERFATVGLARVLSSDLVRAVETARCIGARTGIEVEADPLLRERDFGDLRGTVAASLAVDVFAPDYVPPRGESWATFHARVQLAWDRIKQAAAETNGHVLVVTHGLVCSVLVERHLALAAGAAPPSRWESASVTEVDAVAPWRVRSLNCVAHLGNNTQSAR